MLYRVRQEATTQCNTMLHGLLPGTGMQAESHFCISFMAWSRNFPVDGLRPGWQLRAPVPINILEMFIRICSCSCSSTSNGPVGASQEVSVSSCPLHRYLSHHHFQFSIRCEEPVRLYSFCIPSWSCSLFSHSSHGSDPGSPIQGSKRHRIPDPDRNTGFDVIWRCTAVLRLRIQDSVPFWPLIRDKFSRIPYLGSRITNPWPCFWELSIKILSVPV